jgi:DNA-binding protein HU-beta
MPGNPVVVSYGAMLVGISMLRRKQVKINRGGSVLNKKELVESIAHAAAVSMSTAEKALNGIVAAVSETLEKGENVTLVGFGTFSVSKRKSREGRNPKTGDAITIPEKKVARFKAGTKLLETIN